MIKRHHICLAPGALTAGGIRTAFLILAEALLARGHCVDLLVTRQVMTEVALPKGLRVIQAGTKTRNALPAATRYLAQNTPDAVISARPYIDLLMMAARALSGHQKCKLVWSFHTHQSSDYATRGVGSRLLVRSAFVASRWADSLVAVSDGVAEDIALAFLPAPIPVHTIYNPVKRADRSAAVSEPPHPWLKDKSIPVLLSIGRLVQQKDHMTLLQAFADLRKQRPVRLLILGDGPMRSQLEAVAHSFGCAEEIDFLGHQVQPERFLSKADGLVSTSLWEGFGYVLAEALAWCCPVIAADCPSGPAEVLGHGRYGRLVPPNDPNALCCAIAQALDDPKRTYTFEDDPLDRFDPDRIAQAYLDLLEG